MSQNVSKKVENYIRRAVLKLGGNRRILKKLSKLEKMKGTVKMKNMRLDMNFLLKPYNDNRGEYY